MPQEILNILLSALGIIVTGLTTFFVAKLTAWLDAKIADKNASRFLSTITELVGNCVNEISQTYVEVLKEEGSFDKEAQQKALDMCIQKVESQLGPDLIKYIVTNFGDVTPFIRTLIESAIYTNKRQVMLHS